VAAPAAVSTKQASSSTAAAPKLSKGVLSMKFMKQKESVNDKKVEKEDLVIKKSGESSSDGLVCSTEHFDFVAALPGRRSFNGCNKAVERHYEQVLDDLNYKRKTTSVKTDTISDEEMIKRYESLIGLPRGPNQGKKADNRPISGQKKQEGGYGNKRGNDSNGRTDQNSKKGKFR